MKMLMKYAMQLAALKHTKPRQILYPRRNCGESLERKEYVAIMPTDGNQHSFFESINRAKGHLLGMHVAKIYLGAT